MLVKSCPQCQLRNVTVPLLKEVVIGTGRKPYLVCPLSLHYNVYSYALIIAYVKNGARGLKSHGHICQMCIMGDYGKIVCSLMAKLS